MTVRNVVDVLDGNDTPALIVRTADQAIDDDDPVDLVFVDDESCIHL